MKITSFSPTEPFDIERTGNDDSSSTTQVGVAIGWGLTSEGFAVPVFANAEIQLHHGDRAVVGDMKLVIGLVTKEGEPIFEAGSPVVAKSPGRPPKRRPSAVAMGPWDILFGSKQYKLTSSWHFKSDDKEFVFHVPGETDVPDDPRVEKVNRDTLNELAKKTEELTYEKVIGIESIQSAASPEDAAGDDDVMDMV